MDDHQIIKLFLGRSQQAVDSLEKKYGRLCKAISYNILRNVQDAEECANDAYLAVWNTIPPKVPDSLPAYVAKITRNISLKKYRENTAAKRDKSYEVSLEEICECFKSQNNTCDVVEAKELAAHINEFLKGLGKEDRIMFVQRYWFAREIPEIAESMKRSRNYINVHLYRVREKLRAYLREEELI